MTLYAQSSNQKPILVFLPENAAHIIVSKLNEHGYAATAVSCVPDLFDALRSDRHSLAVTTRPDIDIVRNIKSLPVVNLEVFFHAISSGGDLQSPGKQFDGKAFLQRIKALTEPRPGRIATAYAEPAATNGTLSAVARRASRWRSATTLFLGGRTSASMED